MWSNPTTILRSKAPQQKLLQWSADKRGKLIKQDTNGVMGDPGLWYLQDNGKGKKLRRPQQGRGFKSTGIEWLETKEIVNSYFFYLKCKIEFSSFTVNNFLIGPIVGSGSQNDINIRQTQLVVFNGIDTINWSYPAFDTDRIYDLELHYLGSNNIELFIDGVSQGIRTFSQNYGYQAVPYRYYILRHNQGNYLQGTLYFLEARTSLDLESKTNVLYSYATEEGAGLVAYTSYGTTNHANILLNGSSESGFHITTSDPAVPSRQNQVGFFGDVTRAGQYFDGISVPTPTTWDTVDAPTKIELWFVSTPSTRIIHRVISNQTVVAQNQDSVWIRTTTVNPNIVEFSNLIGALTFGVDIGYQARGPLIHVVLDYQGGFYKVNHITGPLSPSDYTGSSVSALLDLGGRIGTLNQYLQGTIYSFKVWGVGLDDKELAFQDSGNQLNIPIDASGNGKIDVLGNTVSEPYFGPCQFPTQIKDQSVAFFDGNLVLSFTDLTGRSIVSQEGTVTVQISGNNIQPVSGTGKFFYLEFDNGSNYIFCERDGLAVYDGNVTNGLDGTWALNGSAANSQWSTDPTQRPHPLLEGFNLNGNVVVRADLNNPGFDVLGISLVYKANSKGILAEPAMAYDRNFADVGELKGQGIEQGENITHAEITADRSRLYNYDGDEIVEDMLVYDGDGFVEPIAGSIANFDGLIGATNNIPKSATNFIHQNGIFDITFYATFENGTSTDPNNPDELLVTSVGFGINSGFNIFYSNNISGVEGILTFRHGTGTSVTNYSTGNLKSILENGELHKIQFFGDGASVKIYVDDSLEANSAFITGSVTNSDTTLQLCPKHIGKFAMLVIINDTGEEIIFYPTAEEKGFTWFNAGKDKLTASDVTISLNGSAVGDQYLEDGNKNYDHNLLYGFHDDGTSLIPGDPNNRYKDVKGNDIDNKDDVIKFNRINNYLKVNYGTTG